MIGFVTVATGVPNGDGVAELVELDIALMFEDELLKTSGGVPAGLKFVGIFTGVAPAADNTPVAGPVVESSGMIDPEIGINTPFCIVPPIAVVDPAGVNPTIVPFGIVPFISLISDMLA